MNSVDAVQPTEATKYAAKITKEFNKIFHKIDTLDYLPRNRGKRIRVISLNTNEDDEKRVVVKKQGAKSASRPYRFKSSLKYMTRQARKLE